MEQPTEIQGDKLVKVLTHVTNGNQAAVDAIMSDQNVNNLRDISLNFGHEGVQQAMNSNTSDSATTDTSSDTNPWPEASVARKLFLQDPTGTIHRMIQTKDVSVISL